MTNYSGALGGFGIPGQGDAAFVASRELFWGGDNRQIGVLWGNGLVSGAARDAGNDPTSVLRTGLLLGKITATKKFIQWDTAATDGSQNVAGILDVNGLKATDFNGTNADRWLRVVVGKGPLLASALLIKGVALVGHTDEFLARKQLAAAFHILDDDPHGYLAGVAERVAYKTASYSILAADNNTTFFLAGNYRFTLPTIQNGLKFKMVQVSNAAWDFKSAELDNVIVLNDVEADGITFLTGSNMMGAQVAVEAKMVNATLKWVTSSVVGTQSIYT